MRSTILPEDKTVNKNTKLTVVFFISFYIVCCFLSFNRHSKAETFNYHSEIWGDKAGYYVFLPALFIYDFDAKKIPSGIDVKTGEGFHIDSVKNKIVTKYTYGVALMESPFFLATHLLSKRFGYANNGFSLIYDKVLDIAGVFYADLALIFLYFFLLRYVAKNIAFIALSCTFLGTNLFYYSIFDSGMSHIYSFFLFSVFLFLSGLLFTKSGPDNKLKYHIALYAILGLVIGLIMVVRPINVIFLPVFFIFNKVSFSDIKKLVVPLIIIVLFASVLIIPQLIYWKYLSGHFFIYSYPNEGFTNIFPSKLLSFWFSTNNGLVIYGPLVLFIIGGIFSMRRKFNNSYLYLFVYFIIICYVFSSWWSWNYGCSFGCRPMVEYYTLFSLPFCYCIKYILENKFRSYIFGSLILLCIIWNLKLIFSFDGCWYGGDWDWRGFGRFLVSPTK